MSRSAADRRLGRGVLDEATLVVVACEGEQ